MIGSAERERIIFGCSGNFRRGLGSSPALRGQGDSDDVAFELLDHARAVALTRFPRYREHLRRRGERDRARPVACSGRAPRSARRSRSPPRSAIPSAARRTTGRSARARSSSIWIARCSGWVSSGSISTICTSSIRRRRWRRHSRRSVVRWPQARSPTSASPTLPRTAALRPGSRERACSRLFHPRPERVQFPRAARSGRCDPPLRGKRAELCRLQPAGRHGLLTGKYRFDEAPDPQSRLAKIREPLRPPP